MSSSPSMTKRKKIMAVIFVILVFGMFAVRGVLLKNGTIDKIMTLSPDELNNKLKRTEITVTSGDLKGSGTLIDSKKLSTKDEEFSTYAAVAAHVVPDSEPVSNAAEADPADSGIMVTFADGTKCPAVLIAKDEKTDIAVLLVKTKEELEAAYSRDALGRLDSESSVYCLSSTGKLFSGTFDKSNVSINGAGDGLMTVNCSNEEGMSGGGMYDRSGYYIGMIVQGTTDGVTAIVPSSAVEQYVKSCE